MMTNLIGMTLVLLNINVATNYGTSYVADISTKTNGEVYAVRPVDLMTRRVTVLVGVQEKKKQVGVFSMGFTITKEEADAMTSNATAVVKTRKSRLFGD